MMGTLIKGPGYIVGLLFLATLIFGSIPLAYTLQLRVNGIPVINGFYVAVLASVMGACAMRAVSVTRLLSLYLVGGIFLAIVTIPHWNTVGFTNQFFILDLVIYSGLPAGITLAILRGRQASIDFLWISYVVVCGVFTVSVVLLLSGYIESAQTEERQLDGAMYTSSLFLQMALPVVWLRVRRSGWLPRIITWFGAALCIYFAIISATRTTLIASLGSLVLTAFLEVKRDHGKALWFAGGVIVIIVMLISGSGLDKLENSLLASRLESTEVTSEIRFLELTGMLDQMDTGEWIYGTGLGSGFVSPILAEQPGSQRAFFPHISITTLFYKGGVVVFVALILIPSLICIKRLLFSAPSVKDPFLAGVAVYLISSSLSGGWTLTFTFMLGLFLTLGIEKERTRPRGMRSSEVAGDPRLGHALPVHPVRLPPPPQLKSDIPTFSTETRSLGGISWLTGSNRC